MGIIIVCTFLLCFGDPCKRMNVYTAHSGRIFQELLINTPYDCVQATSAFWHVLGRSSSSSIPIFSVVRKQKGIQVQTLVETHGLLWKQVEHDGVQGQNMRKPEDDMLLASLHHDVPR